VSIGGSLCFGGFEMNRFYYHVIAAAMHVADAVYALVGVHGEFSMRWAKRSLAAAIAKAKTK